jgi:tripartite-type tricarboxylate transporter receptor subunit TctC
MRTRRQVLAASAAGLMSAVTGAVTGIVSRASAQAPNNPAINKPVRIIVGFPAGGGTDTIARILAERLRGPYASTVLVENKPGASARLAVEYVKNAEPDGSVVLFTPDFPLTIYPHSFKSLSYDSVRDFTAIAPAAKSMLTYNIGPAVPESVKTLAAFVEWCKANPAKAAYATTSAGGTPHFVGMMLASEARVSMTAVHYRGGAPALQDLLGGHVPAAVNPISESLPFARAGSLRILAVTGSKRSTFLPDVPTMAEAGYKVISDSWLGVLGPAKMPVEIVNALSSAIGEAVKVPQMIESLAKVGNEPTFQSPADFAATLKADIARWGPVVKASGFVAED